MYKLFENFRRYLNEDNNIAHNVNLLLTSKSERYQDEFETLPEKFGLSKENVIEIAKNIPPLKNSKIIKVLASGLFGIAFQLENDHVLKLFVGGVGDNDDNSDSSETEIIKYRNMQDRQFNGTSHQGEPAIYDFGKFSFNRDEPTNNSNKQSDSEFANQTTHKIKENNKIIETPKQSSIYYVELGRVIPFDVWMRQNNLDKEKFTYGIRKIMYLIRSIDNKELINSRSFFKAFKIAIEKAGTNKFSGQEMGIFYDIIKNLAKYIEKSGLPSDFHSGNFGIIPAKGRNIFVFFDV